VQARTVAGRKTKSGNFGDRVIEWQRKRWERNSTEANHIGSFAAENGAGTKSEMGELSKGIEARSDRYENNELGSVQAYHVGGSSEKDRGGTAGTMGKDSSGTEESGVGPKTPQSEHNVSPAAWSSRRTRDARRGIRAPDKRRAGCDSISSGQYKGGWPGGRVFQRRWTHSH
jgi:hypothetical protein